MQHFITSRSIDLQAQRRQTWLTHVSQSLLFTYSFSIWQTMDTLLCLHWKCHTLIALHIHLFSLHRSLQSFSFKTSHVLLYFLSQSLDNSFHQFFVMPHIHWSNYTVFLCVNCYPKSFPKNRQVISIHMYGQKQIQGVCGQVYAGTVYTKHFLITDACEFYTTIHCNFNLSTMNDVKLEKQ